MPTNHLISLPVAVAMTTIYRANREAILANGYQNKNVLPLSETFDRSIIDDILGQTGCTALRIYYGMDESYLVHAILVGVNNENEDILPSTQETTSLTMEEDPGDIIGELSIRCPEDCPPDSPLNTNP